MYLYLSTCRVLLQCTKQCFIGFRRRHDMGGDINMFTLHSGYMVNLAIFGCIDHFKNDNITYIIAEAYLNHLIPLMEDHGDLLGTRKPESIVQNVF